MSVRIEVLTTPECPHAEAAIERVRGVASRLVPDAEIQTTVVEDAALSIALDFPGSPTVLVNGKDLEGDVVGPGSYACRTYGSDDALPPTWLVEARLLNALRPAHVLFLCVANSARSQMAEGVARKLAPAAVTISSAGSEPSRVRPQAVRALAEIGIDASTQRSKSFDEFRDEDVDCVITLCAEENCPVWLGDAWRVHWALPDPAAVTGSDAEVMSSFRAVRDELWQRMKAMFEQIDDAMTEVRG